jgi:uncharacterized protein YeaO (DUF488 family)
MGRISSTGGDDADGEAQPRCAPHLAHKGNLRRRAPWELQPVGWVQAADKKSLSKRDLEDVLWIRDVAPSTSLRKWFGHKSQRWAEFRRRYFAELRVNPAVEGLRDIIAAGPVTLIYGAHDEIHNQAVALAEYLGQSAAREDDR